MRVVRGYEVEGYVRGFVDIFMREGFGDFRVALIYYTLVDKVDVIYDKEGEDDVNDWFDGIVMGGGVIRGGFGDFCRRIDKKRCLLVVKERFFCGVRDRAF